MTQAKTIDCPQCGKPARIAADNPYRPFCSKRCKLVDLGDWLDESNRIPDPSGSAPGAGPADDPEGGLPH
ncbi:hypothetical protein T35B1_05483 [Salinisphaera shabanensis T35B1]|uniref:DNA gyrase inhibitor YacG n=1 Tax=Salinisphaera shabanensis TaxID=180542 RepID=UPI00333F83C9